MKNYKYKNKINTGFTLVETLVAISIFSVSVLALISIISQGITNTSYAKSKIIAGYLAQEGIETMRNMRDTYVLYDSTIDPVNGSPSNGWAKFMTKLTNAAALCNTTNGCYFDSRNLDPSNHTQPVLSVSVAACNASCPDLLYNSMTGIYGYASGNDSGFNRKIQVTQVSADQRKVYSIVSWKQGSSSYNISFAENFFNWVH